MGEGIFCHGAQAETKDEFLTLGPRKKKTLATFNALILKLNSEINQQKTKAIFKFWMKWF